MNHRQQNLIIPFAKASGYTSFKSMVQLKKVIGTKKVGHTGTLDSFADGLLVLLSGQYTKLASYIVTSEKEYMAWIQFGSETATLCPNDPIVKRAPLPSRTAFDVALKKWHGTVEQIPPQYSAIHIDGKRASDRMRHGESIAMPTRQVTISELECIKLVLTRNDCVQQACIRVVCSKGTYIRSLARDIATTANSVAHLSALRRMRIGTFRLEEALAYSVLPEFLAESTILPPPALTETELVASALTLKPSIAQKLNLFPLYLKAKHYRHFLCGKPLQPTFFENNIPFNTQCAVFLKDNCVGIITRNQDYLKYTVVFSNT